jgi:acyl-CoA reductase-like NAD-dependent aldehyde dehydrogenase
VVTAGEVPNLVGGRRVPAASGAWLDKLRPADGTFLCRVARSGAQDVDAAVAAARAAQPAWAELTPVARGDVVRELALLLRDRGEEASALVAEETGKPLDLARGETDAAVEMGLFVAGEGRRSYGRTTTASMPHRTVLTVRQPLGVAALIMSFNTPLPNVAWKAFPAIFCGNAAVVKPSEHSPASASLFGELALEARRRRGAGSTRPPLVVSRRSASSSEARTRSSSVTTPISTGPSSGRSPPRSRTPVSGAPRRAASSCSTPCTRPFASGCWKASPGSSRNP